MAAFIDIQKLPETGPYLNELWEFLPLQSALESQCLCGVRGIFRGDYVDAGGGNDYVVAGGGTQTIVGGSGDNTIYSGSNSADWATSYASTHNQIYGGSGNSTIHGSGGNDTLVSESESETGKATTIYAGDGKQTIVGGDGNDKIFGGAGINTIYAGDGDSTITLSKNASETSTVYGGDGSLTIVGGAGTDVIHLASGGTDSAPTRVTAGSGTTTIYGGSGTEILQGSEEGGTTLFVAGTGNQTITGGMGRNTYQFNKGFGDVVLDIKGQTNQIEFGEGITLDDLSFGIAGSGTGGDLLITDRHGGSIRIAYGLVLEQITYKFSDGGAAVHIYDLLAQNKPIETPQVDLDQLKTEYLAVVEKDLLRGERYTLQADGNWHHPAVESGSIWLRYQKSSQIFATKDGSKTTESSSWQFFPPVIYESTSSFTYSNVVADGDYLDVGYQTQFTSYTTQAGLQVSWPSLPLTNTWYSGPEGAWGYTYADGTVGVAPKPGAVSTYGQLITQVDTYQGPVSPRHGNIENSLISEYLGMPLSGGGDNIPSVIPIKYEHRQFVRNIVTVNVADGNHHVVGGDVVNVGTGNNTIEYAGLVNDGPGNSIINVAEIVIDGAGDDIISEAEHVYAGAGNNRIYDSGQIYNGSGNDLIDHVYAVYGGSGNDVITNSLDVYAGSGDDLLVGNKRVVAGAGNDTILGSQAGSYSSDSITISRENVGNVIIGGKTYFTQPTVYFGAGLQLADINLSWGQVSIAINGVDYDEDYLVVGPTTQPKSTYTTLTIDWGTEQSVQVIMAHTSDGYFAGADRFVFDDGTIISMADLVAMAPPAPSFDPHLRLTELRVGMGQQTVDIAAAQGLVFGPGISSANSEFELQGVDLRIGYGSMGDSVLVKNFVLSPSLSWTYEDGTQTTFTSTGINLHLNSNNANGFKESVTYTLAGVKLDATWTRADGSHGTYLRNADGSTSSFEHDVNDRLVSENWTGDGAPGSSSGSRTYVFNPDGSTFKELIQTTVGGTSYRETTVGHPDGSSDVVWTRSDGASGTKTYNADGSGADTFVNADGAHGSTFWNVGRTVGGGETLYVDGSRTRYTYDPEYKRDYRYDVSGVLLEESWYRQADKVWEKTTYGSDGSSLRETHFADGRYNTATDDGHGEVVTTYFAASGLQMGQSTPDNDVINGQSGNDMFSGGAGNDALYGAQGDDMLEGGSGNDILSGGMGNDRLDGGTGADTMTGGEGDDTYVAGLGDKVIELANQGTDTVIADVSFSLRANVENLTLVGDKAINGTGNDLANVLIGNAAKNTLNGRAGADTMTGGNGADTYHVDNVGDVVIEAEGGGIDRVIAAVSYALGAHVEDLQLSGTAANSAAGNALGNKLTGNSGANTLTGGAGDDRLIGGAGADVLWGGTGDDLYEVDNTGDTVIELADEGIDTVEAAVSLTLGAHTENLILTGTAAIDGTGNEQGNSLQGNASANLLIGHAGNDVLNGMKGRDTLIGGSGNDTYIFEDDVDDIVEEADGGRDTVLSRLSVALAAHVEDGMLLGSAAALTGNELSNVLTGNSASNTLDGGGGADVLIGGKGNDLYILDNQADTVVELAREGNDTVHSSVNYALADNLENLVLVGVAEAGMGNDANNKLTGNAASNKLWGGSGSDSLDGAAGADILFGGMGNDKYWVDSSDDLVVENAGEGTDIVHAGSSYALADNIEHLSLTGSADINAIGNSGNNRLEGNAGNNVLFGGLGNDTYVWGRGSGQDIVANFDAGKPSGDAIQLGAGISASDLSLTRLGDDLVMQIHGSNDQLTVASYFENAGKGANALEKIRFADGTSWNHAAVISRTASASGPSAAQDLPAEVRAGNPTALFDAPQAAPTQPSDGQLVPQTVSQSIAAARERFEQGLQNLKFSVDAQGSLSRSEFVERRAMPLLWNLQDALLNLQLAKNADGRFTANISMDSRAGRDLGLAIAMLGGTDGKAGQLGSWGQVVRPQEVQQFDLAQIH